MELIGSSGLSSVIDWKWLSEYGAIPATNSAAYATFANTTSGPGVLGDWNTKAEYGMMGTGPYKVTLYEPAQKIILEKNPYYHQTAGPFSLSTEQNNTKRCNRLPFESGRSPPTN
ncbi:MAG: hypothetical protein QW292_14005 [Candidatus Parvarchaeota archaeon]